MDIKIIPLSSEWHSQASQMIQRTIRISQKSIYKPELLEKCCQNFNFEKFSAKTKEVEFFIALDTAIKKTVGIIGLKDNELKTFFVDPDYQGKGVGRRLYSKLELVVRERKIEKLILFGSPLGEPIYRKFGFHKVKTVTDNLDGIEFEDAYMEKELV
jgi:GNAT superfamily N-acetyltransferase